MYEVTIQFPAKLISKRRLQRLGDEYSADRVLGDVDGQTFTLVFERDSAKDALLAASSAMDALDDSMFDA